MSLLLRLAAELATVAHQPLTSFCDINTATDQELITHAGDAATVVRILGVRRTLADPDIDAIADALRRDLSGALDEPGHALQFWFGADPDAAGAEVRRLLQGPRAMAGRLGLSLDAIFAEREARLPKALRREAAFLVLWTRRGSSLTPAEAKIAQAQIAAGGRQWPDMGDAQLPYLATDLVLSRHRAFVDRVLGALRAQGVMRQALDPRTAIREMREALLPETIGTGWSPSLPGDPVMARAPDEGREPCAGDSAWPNLAEQILTEDAAETSLSTVRMGAHEWAGIDMWLGPERPESFARLVHALAADRIPWRASFLVEGGGDLAFGAKAVAAQMLSFLPSPRAIAADLEDNRKLRDAQRDVLVRLRASFATWAPAAEPGLLDRRKATLQHRVQTWGAMKAKFLAGDPIAGVMSSTFGFAAASTGKPAQAPFGQALRMMPIGRPGSPWTQGPVLFRTPDGAPWPYDPASPVRIKVTDAHIGPSRRGKSVLANTNLLGHCLSGAAEGRDGARLPLVGKIDIGRSAEGLVVLLREALPRDRRGQALFVKLRPIPGHAFNMLDTHVACRRPNPMERAAQENFVSLVATEPGERPHEGMSQLIPLVLEEAYRMLGTEGPNTRPKRYEPGIEPAVDAALARHRIALPDAPWWWDAVDALCERGEWAAAGHANRQAVPRIPDLISAARSEQVRQMFSRVVPNNTETLVEVFERYLTAFSSRFPHLCAPTRIDFGQARIIVLDLDAVAPTGSRDSDWQTSVYYLAARHMIGRNFFVHPDYAEEAPEVSRGHLRERFAEAREGVKRLEYDEYQRTANQPDVRAQVERDDREGAKHNVQIGISTQRATDLGEHLLSQATALWVCGVGDTREADDLGERRNLAPATRTAIKTRLHGPDRERGGGAPFVLVLNTADAVHEQMLVNQLGPMEIWALSTTPEDSALRDALYDRLGFGEALRRLAGVFPKGSCVDEAERRRDRRMRQGEDRDRAEQGVVQELADELANGTGLGMRLRDPATLPLAAE